MNNEFLMKWINLLITKEYMTFDYLVFASRGYLQKIKTKKKQISHIQPVLP